jgi:cytochrome c553
MAATLTDDDIADLAAYYSAQVPTGLEADPSYWKAGQKLYRGGDPARNIPACIACHGPTGKGNPPAGYPSLRAQHAAYTQKQLQAYVAGTRPGDQAQIMKTIAQRLTAEDIRNLASYIQGIR